MIDTIHIVQNAPSLEYLRSWRNICPSTDRQDLLLQHIWQLAGPSPILQTLLKIRWSLRCVVCEKSFKTDGALESNQVKAHAPKVISYLECGYCDNKSMNQCYMTDHKKDNIRVMAQIVLFISCATPESRMNICLGSTAATHPVFVHNLW